MKIRPIFILVAAFPLTTMAAETVAPAPSKPSVMQRLLNPFGGDAEPAAPTPPPAPAKVAAGKKARTKSAAAPAPATPKPSLMDRLLHPFGDPATTEPSPAPTPPAVEKDASQKTPKSKSAAATPAAEPAAAPKTGVMHRLLHPFGSPAASGGARDASLKSVEMGASVEPPAPKLAETREVKVTVTLANKGKKLAQLAFPTNQRIEVLLKDKAGKKLVQWSEDQAFFAEPTLITINPGERLEYAASVSTRDLVAGETYTVEAFFPSYPELRRTLGLAPEK